MAKILRKDQKIFAISGGAVGQFGSAQSGSPILTLDIDDIQALAAYGIGWVDATISGDKRPPLEEDNGIKYLTTYQISYLLQEGIAEYSAGTDYYIGSLVKQSGTSIIFKSLIDDNLGNPLVDGLNWKELGDLVNLANIGNSTKIQGEDVLATTPITGSVLRYNGADWDIYNKSNGALYFNMNALVTTILAINTPAKINATYLSEELADFSFSAGRLTYNGTLTKKFTINVSLNLWATANNLKCSIYIAKNGVADAITMKSSESGSTNEGQFLATNKILSLSNTDFIEIFAENNDNANDITVENLYCLISEL